MKLSGLYVGFMALEWRNKKKQFNLTQALSSLGLAALLGRTTPQ